MGRITRRVHQPGAYFITTDTWQRRALFINHTLGKIVVDQTINCRDRGFYKLHAFVVMPDHLHLLLTPSEATTIEKAMQMIKGGSSHRMGQDRPHTFPIWHSGFHDRWMRSEQEFRECRLYIEQNPVVARLVEQPEAYFLSSASGQYRLDLSALEEDRG
jgi:putative transposase